MIITVANRKGGVGKTTTSVILAYISTTRGYKTVLVDMDRQKNAFDKVMLEDETQEGTFKPVFRNLDCIVADDRIPEHDELSQYDIAVVDTPPRADTRSIRGILAKSDAVVAPFLMSKDALGGIAELFDQLPADGRLVPFPLHLVSPMETHFEKSLYEVAYSYFADYGIYKKDIIHWPMRKNIINNIGFYKPFYFGLMPKDKDIYFRTFDLIVRTIKEVRR